MSFSLFFFSSRRRHTRLTCDWSSDVCSSDLIEAIVAGVETMCRVGLAVPGKFHARHFHPTSLTATFAGAVVAGKLGGLDEDQLVNALEIGRASCRERGRSRAVAGGRQEEGAG